MQAQRVGDSGAGGIDGAFGGQVDIGDQGVRAAAVDQSAVGGVVAVDEVLGDRPQSPSRRDVQHGRPGQTEQRQPVVEGHDRLDHRARLVLVVDDRVVEGAVGLHVRHRATDRAGQRVQRPDLVDHGGSKIIGRDVQEAAAEADQVRIADLGPDHDTALDRGPAGAAQGGRIAGVETAGHVRTGDHGQHRVVVAETPVPEGLSEVGVQVDGHLAIVAARPWQRAGERVWGLGGV